MGNLTESDFPKLASPALRALAGAGYTRLEQLTKVTEAELSQLHGMGPNALTRLRQALKERGWSFAKGKPGKKQAKHPGQ
ncbi:MAG: DNA-binding protein [Chloroflexota bacterium]